jgi:glucose/arabinose dehydrogenase
MKRWPLLAAFTAVIILAIVGVEVAAQSGDTATQTAAPSSSAGPTTASTGFTTTSSTAATATAVTRGAAPPAIKLQKIPGAYDFPVYVAAPPGDTSRLFVVEKSGRIRIVRNGAVLAKPFVDLSGQVSGQNEQGLLSMAFDPHFATNSRIYVDYTDRAGDTRVMRYTVSGSNPDVADPTSARVLLAITQPHANHNGGQLQFGPDGKLYVGMGDGGSAGDPQDRGQNVRTPLGKILRVKLGATPEVTIYAKGLRNPWRFSFDRSTGALWIGDVGQNKWEEVDYLKPGRPAGANLGWSAFEGSHLFKPAVAAVLDRSKLVWPVAQYSHAVGDAVVGGYVYRGSAIPALRGWYLFGDYETGRIWALKRGAGGAKPLSGADKALANITSFGQDASGELYVASPDGSVYKIVK